MTALTWAEAASSTVGYLTDNGPEAVSMLLTVLGTLVILVVSVRAIYKVYKKTTKVI